MTKTIATNSNNDIYLDASGNLAVLTGQEAVAAACRTASLLQLCEAIYQTNLGLPNFQAIWVGVPNLAIYEAYLRKTIQSVECVVSITSLKTSVENNVLRYTATVESVYGSLYLNG